MADSNLPAGSSGVFALGSSLVVTRLGFGTMRITGPGIWGEPAQLALAWLLRRSPVMLPIPGTASVAHLEENVGSAQVELTEDQFVALSGLG